jgi:hypothetical protein
MLPCCHLESISPTILCNAQIHQHKVNSQKMLFCLTNISAKIFLHILYYSFCDECHILVHFCQMLLPAKTSNIIYTDASYALATGVLVKGNTS